MKALLTKAVEEKYPGLLKTYSSYIDSYPQYFQNPDSMQLAGNLAYAQFNQEDNLPALLEEFVEKYEAKNAPHLAALALQMSQETFKRPVLQYATRLADQSLQIEKSTTAYLAKALAHDRMGEYKPSYAFLLLAYAYADEEMTEMLSQYEAQIKKKLSYEFANGVNTIKENGDDGRFTLGAGTKRLMYGFPIPKSTSHFIVNIDGKLASNGGHLKDKGVTHLMGTMHYTGEGATPRVSIAFEFKKVRITQTLTPVDKEGKEITTGFAQSYRISYKFENLEFTPKSIGLGMLFDTMIDDNDYCTIAADGKIVNEERSFQFNAVPKELLFYRTRRDTSDMMGAAQLVGMDATPPDQVVVGRWPVLHNVTWNLNPQRVPYGDSGYFLKWENKPLPQGGNLTLSTYYGLPEHKTPALRIVMEGENYLTKTENVYFEHKSAELDLNAKMKITQMLEDKDLIITGVLLNGYSDITGQEDFNFKLSQRRIENVGKIFAAYGIAHVPKPYGVEQSDTDELNKRYGNTWDRRVEIIMYYKKRPAGQAIAGNE